MSAKFLYCSQRQRTKKVQGSPSLGESLSELVEGELYEQSVPMELQSENVSKGLMETEVLKTEAVFSDVPGSASPRVSSSLTPKHDFDISFTDTGMLI